MLEAERQFRRIIGYADLAKLVTAIERETHRPTIRTPPTRPLRSSTPNSHTGTAVTKFHGERGMLVS